MTEHSVLPDTLNTSAGSRRWSEDLMARATAHTSRSMPSTRRLPLVYVAAAALMAGTAAADGYIHVPDLMTPQLKKQYPAYASPTVWVYDETGNATGNAAGYKTSENVAVPEGWYLVEVGNRKHEKNRAKVFVKDGQVTVIPTGLVLLTTDSLDAQPADLCRAWDSGFQVALPIGKGPDATVGSNFRADRHKNGAVLVVAGYYRIAWNGHWVAAEVKAGKALQVPTGFAGPMSGPGYRLHVEKKATRKSPGLKMCERRATRVLARRYWVSIMRRISQPPFKERAWETLDVPQPEGEPYTRLKAPRVKGRVYRGPGDAPLLMWEVPDAPAPEATPDDVAPVNAPTGPDGTSPPAPTGEPQ